MSACSRYNHTLFSSLLRTTSDLPCFVARPQLLSKDKLGAFSLPQRYRWKIIALGSSWNLVGGDVIDAEKARDPSRDGQLASRFADTASANSKNKAAVCEWLLFRILFFIVSFR